MRGRRFFLGSVGLGLMGLSTVRVQSAIQPLEAQADDKLQLLDGTITSLFGDRIVMLSVDGQTLTIYANDRMRVWKRRAGRDLASLAVGDAVACLVEFDSTGRLQLRKLWANIENLYGEIVAVAGSTFEVMVYNSYGAVGKSITVHHSADTTVQVGQQRRASLKVGDFVQVTGVRLSNGTVEATRLFGYPSP